MIETTNEDQGVFSGILVVVFAAGKLLKTQRLIQFQRSQVGFPDFEKELSNAGLDEYSEGLLEKHPANSFAPVGWGDCNDPKFGLGIHSKEG